MIRFLKDSNLSFSNIWKAYLYLVLSSTFVWLTLNLYYIKSNFGELFFLFVVLASANLLIRNLNHPFWEIIEDEALTLFFYIQFLCTLGHFYVSQDIGTLYLALLPMSLGMIHFRAQLITQQNRKEWPHFVYTFSFFILAFVTLSTYKISPLSKVELTGFLIFSLFTVGGIYFFSLYWMKSQRSFWYQLIRHIYKEHHADHEEQEKLVFHDIINQTHGIRLFLEGHRSQGQSVPPEKISILISEIEVLQEILADHFGRGHKNLEDKKLLVKLPLAISVFHNLLSVYLPENRVDIQTRYSENYSRSDWKNYQVNLPNFHRILTNILKNLSEYRVSRLKIHFDLDERYLIFSFKNPLKVMNINSQDLGEYLKTSILEMDRPGKRQNSGLGLISTQNLAEKMGGHFYFWVEDGHWHSKIMFPVLSKAAHQSKKKAA